MDFALNNISAAANIMGETERKSIKLAAVENVCSEILPFLFVSGEAVARNLPLLKAKGITHIINCAGIECRNHFESEFQYVTIKLADSKTSRIDRYVHVLINEIDEILLNNPDTEDAIKELINLALARGGRDNVTVSLVESPSPILIFLQSISTSLSKFFS